MVRLAACTNYGVELGNWKLVTGSNLRSIWRFDLEIPAPFFVAGFKGLDIER